MFSKVAMIQIIFDVQKSTPSHSMKAKFVARTPLSDLLTPMADDVIRQGFQKCLIKTFSHLIIEIIQNISTF